MRLIVCVKVYREKFNFEEFKDADHVLALVKSGSFYLSDGQQETVIRENQATIFWGENTYYRKVRTPVTMYLFRFQSKQSMQTELAINFEDQARLASTFALLEKLDKGSFADDFKYRRVLFEDLMLQYVLEHTDCDMDTIDDTPIQNAIEFIKNSLHKKINLTEVADEVNLSYVYFSKRFKSVTGLTPSDYLASERMRLARDLLLNTDLRIKDIASSCGFENEYYFSNFFHKHNGVSPSDFRKNAI